MSTETTRRKTFSSVGPMWSAEEAGKLFQADQKAQEIQNKIDDSIRILLQCPQIRDKFPQLLTFNSRVRNIEPSQPDPVSENVKEVETILSNIKQGSAIKDNFKKLSDVFTNLNHLDPSNASIHTMIEIRETLKRLIAFAEEEEALLMNPQLYASFYGLDKVPNEVTSKILQQYLNEMKELYEKVSQDVLSFCQQQLNVPEKALSEIDQIILAAALIFLPSPQYKNVHGPMAEGFAMTSMLMTKQKKANAEEALSQKNYIEGAIANYEKVETLAQELLNDDNPESLMHRAHQILNENTLSSLPLTAQLKTLKSLTEGTPLTQYFQRKTMKFVEALLTEEPVEQPSEKDSNDPCVIQ